MTQTIENKRVQPGGLNPFNVEISGKNYKCEFWDNKSILKGSILAFDTETSVVDFPETPVLALSTASNGEMTYLIHPTQTAHFIRLHKDHHWVFQNCAFDFWVINKYLNDTNDSEVMKILFEAVDRRLLHDTMILDMLIRLGRNDDYPDPRNLEYIAKTYCNMEISKEDPYRMRYSEIIDKNWHDVDFGFFNYACKDTIVTYYAFLQEFKEARKIADKNNVLRANQEKYGPLTENIQIKGYITTYKISQNGFCIDENKAKETHNQIKEKIYEILEQFKAHPESNEMIKVNKRGEIEFTETGTPRMKKKVLQTFLLNIAMSIGLKDKDIPKTEKGQVSTALKQWEDHIDKHWFLKLYADFIELAKLSTFFKAFKGTKLHPKYSIFVRTGRTSSYAINLQQCPRSGIIRDGKEVTGGVREVFHASDGYLLLAVDYSFIELRTLARVLETMYGKSILADVIRSGKDPHIHTASMFTGRTYEEFLKLKQTDEYLFKKARQEAKIVNFGLPGGLGAESLQSYAKHGYGVDFSFEKATFLRNTLLEKIYPELGWYLKEDTCAILCGNLFCSISEFWEELGFTDRPEWVCPVIGKILRGNLTKKSGGEYKPEFVDRVWQCLRSLNRNASIKSLIESRDTSGALYKTLFWEAVKTESGLIRGQVSFCAKKNTAFQGKAAEGAKLTMYELLKRNYRLIGFVHDELIIELPDLGGYVLKSTIEEVQNIMNETMALVTPGIPIKTDFTLTKHWKKDAKMKFIDDRVYIT